MYLQLEFILPIVIVLTAIVQSMMPPPLCDGQSEHRAHTEGS